MSIKHPATIIVCGGTGSGKTVLTEKLIRHHELVFDGMPHNPRIVWLYGAVAPARMTPSFEVHEGMIDESYLFQERPDIVVVDDLMREASKEPILHNLFTKFSHHLSITVIYITQNLFEKGQVNLKRNAHYIFLTRNPSDKSQLTVLGRQMYPRSKRLLEHFYEAYEDATSNRFGYLLIDVSPESIETQKLKTNIFPDQNGRIRVIVYQPKK